MADDAGPSSAGAGPSSQDGGEDPSTSTAVSAAWTPAENPSGIKPILQNIVATCNLATELDLKTIALKARNAEYNPKRFAAVIMRIRDPKTTALIFRSGKMVVTGAKSEEDARMAARKYARIIQKLDFPARFADFKIQNMVRPADAPARPEHAGSERRSARLLLRSARATSSSPFASRVSRTSGHSAPNKSPLASAGPCRDRLYRSHLCSHHLTAWLACAARRHSHYSSYEPELFPGLIYRMVQPKIVLLIFVSGKVVLTGGKVRKEIYAAFEQIYPVLQEFRKSSADAQPAAA